jgi:hypothetical protein
VIITKCDNIESKGGVRGRMFQGGIITEGKIMEEEPLLLKIETLIGVLTSLGHNSLWFRSIDYGTGYPPLEFIVTWGNRRLAQWSVLHRAWTVTDEILRVPLSGSRSVPQGEPVDNEWKLNRMIAEPVSSKEL